jgi:hypothetical protein
MEIPKTPMAYYDDTTGLLIDTVATSPFRDTILIFIVEGDAQNGLNQVGTHHSLA